MLYETTVFPENRPLLCGISEVEDYPFHMHNDVLEIIFALEGAFELTVVNNVLRMEAGDIYVSCPRELHRLCAYDQTKGTVMLLQLNVEAYQEEFPDLRTYQFANSALESNSTGIQMLGSYLKKQLPRLLDWEAAGPAHAWEVGKRILNTLIEEFQCYYLGSGFPEFNRAYKGNEVQLRRIRRITDYIYRNYDKPIKIEDVAAMEHISANHLTSILKNGCGVGFRTFLNMARVEKSAALLLDSGKGLQTVACECGFSKYKYFSESFEKSFRTKPQQYREKYRDCTIGARPRRCRELEGEELEALLRRFAGKAGEVRLDCSARPPGQPWVKPGRIRLTGASYEPVSGFPLLRQIAGELSFHTLEVDMAFLRRYRSSLKTLEHILADVWSLGMGLCVRVPWGEPPRGVKGLVEFLQKRFGRRQGRLEFVLLEGAEGEQPRALGEYLADCGYEVRTAPDAHPAAANPLFRSGYMPCYLLHALAGGGDFPAGPPLLMDGPGEAEGLALLSPAGVRRPVYHLLYLLERLGDTRLAQGESHIITRQSGTEDFQVLLYHYDACFDALFESGSKGTERAAFVELMTQDQGSFREITLRLEHVVGRYALRKYRLTAEEYAAREREFPLRAAGGLSGESLRVLNGGLEPEMSLHLLELDGSYSPTFPLAPFEILLLCFEKL